MATVARLVTFVDVNDRVRHARQMSLSARHEAVLADGRRVLLLDDRGWASSLRGGHDIWGVTSVDDIKEEARVVVGPDEPFGGRSQEEMESDRWAYLSQILRQQGVNISAEELAGVPQDVVLSERVLARVGRDPTDAVSP